MMSIIFSFLLVVSIDSFSFTFVKLSTQVAFLLHHVDASDVCQDQRCKCSVDSKLVNCDSRKWKNLDGLEFPPTTGTLTLVKNYLKFDTGSNDCCLSHRKLVFSF